MNFTKEQFLEALKTKLTNDGKKKLLQSERSFNGQVERIYSRLEEIECEKNLDEVVQVYLIDFEEYEGDFRKLNSDHFKEKMEWEKNHPNKNNDGNSGDGGEKSELQKMQEQINALLKREEDNNKAKAISEKRSQLKSALKGKDVKNEDWINDQLEFIHIDSETDVDALTERLLKSYNKFSANTPPYVTPGGAGGGSEQTEDYADVVAIVKKQSYRE